MLLGTSLKIFLQPLPEIYQWKNVLIGSPIWNEKYNVSIQTDTILDNHKKNLSNKTKVESS